MSYVLHMASGREFTLPLFDPVAASHIQSPSSYIDTLLSEINGGLYAALFKDKSGLTFLDIGANIGLVSLYAADSCARIVALEPSPDTFPVLKAMTMRQMNIEPVCAALAPEDGPSEFFLNDQNTTASSTVNTFGRFMTVQGFTLTSILSIHQLEHVDIAKIDCEGGEVDSLSFEELERARPIVDSWYIETHNTPKVPWESTMSRLIDALSRLGYSKQVINGMTLFAQ